MKIEEIKNLKDELVSTYDQLTERITEVKALRERVKELETKCEYWMHLSHSYLADFEILGGKYESLTADRDRLREVLMGARSYIEREVDRSCYCGLGDICGGHFQLTEIEAALKEGE